MPSSKSISSRLAPAWAANLKSILVAVAIALSVRGVLAEAFKIPSGSMIPTLAIGDQIFVNKLRYGVRIPWTTYRLIDLQAPQAGEVAVFVAPISPGDDFIKRVIGVAGDEVSVVGGIVRINGQALPREPLGAVTYWDREGQAGPWYAFKAEAFRERLGSAEYTVIQDRERPHPDFGPYRVPPGHVLMMGDNRDHSYDGRDWGPVPLNHMLGRAIFVWWSWGQHGLALSRLFHWVP